jgi:sodium-independent sulfate anion transporter 11
MAFGLTSLGFLYLVRFGCHYASQRFQHKGVFYFGIMRNGLVVILGTLASFLVNRGKQVSVISIIRNVPPGFDALAVPALDARILAAASSVLPSILLLLVLEHLSVAKSFGRISGYSIRPNQEIFAIGVSNVLGSFFG